MVLIFFLIKISSQIYIHIYIYMWILDKYSVCLPLFSATSFILVIMLSQNGTKHWLTEYITGTCTWMSTANVIHAALAFLMADIWSWKKMDAHPWLYDRSSNVSTKYLLYRFYLQSVPLFHHFMNLSICLMIKSFVCCLTGHKTLQTFFLARNTELPSSTKFQDS